MEQLQSAEQADPFVVDILNYRGYTIRFKFDDPGQEVFTNDWPEYDKSEYLGFGAYNTNWKEDMETVIDDKLDTIYRWSLKSDYAGARLVYSKNPDNQDIFLYYRTRLIKVYLNPEKPIKVEDYIQDAEELLKTLIEVDN